MLYWILTSPTVEVTRDAIDGSRSDDPVAPLSIPAGLMQPLCKLKNAYLAYSLKIDAATMIFQDFLNAAVTIDPSTPARVTGPYDWAPCFNRAQH
jgi:hypothetical protein